MGGVEEGKCGKQLFITYVAFHKTTPKYRMSAIFTQ